MEQRHGKIVVAVLVSAWLSACVVYTSIGHSPAWGTGIAAVVLEIYAFVVGVVLWG